MRSSRRFFRGSVALFEMIEDMIFFVMSNLYFFFNQSRVIQVDFSGA